MRLIILGTRGLPPRYGGRETATEEIGQRLVAMGHQVTVYGRSESWKRRVEDYSGIEQVSFATVPWKGVDSLVHVLGSAFDLIVTGRRGVVVLSDVGTAAAIPLLWLAGYRTVWWVDGPAWERAKWGWGARFFLKACARLGIRLADEVIVDSRVAATYYHQHFGRQTRFIPYGPTVHQVEDQRILSELGLEPEQYVLFVGRLTPEKGVHSLVRAFRSLDTPNRLVIVGDNPYDHAYVRQLREAADDRVIFAGYQFGAAFGCLMQGCAVYVQPSEVEGTSPVLLTAMGYGRPVVVQGIPENLETIGDAGLSYEPGDMEGLQSHLRTLLADEDLRKQWGHRALERVTTEYDWDRIATDFAAACAEPDQS